VPSESASAARWQSKSRCSSSLSCDYEVADDVVVALADDVLVDVTEEVAEDELEDETAEGERRRACGR